MLAPNERIMYIIVELLQYTLHTYAQSTEHSSTEIIQRYRYRKGYARWIRDLLMYYKN